MPTILVDSRVEVPIDAESIFPLRKVSNSLVVCAGGKVILLFPTLKGTQGYFRLIRGKQSTAFQLQQVHLFRVDPSSVGDASKGRDKDSGPAKCLKTQDMHHPRCYLGTSRYFRGFQVQIGYIISAVIGAPSHAAADRQPTFVFWAYVMTVFCLKVLPNGYRFPAFSPTCHSSWSSMPTIIILFLLLLSSL